MRDIIISILGEYTPNVSTTTGKVLGGIESLDFTWIVGAILFLICVWSVFKILGVLLKRC